MKEIVVGAKYLFRFNNSFGDHKSLEAHNGEVCKVRCFDVEDGIHKIYRAVFSDNSEFDVYDIELYALVPSFRLIDSVARIHIV